MNKNNIMRKIGIGKITLNIGAGKDQNKLEKGTKLLKRITGIEPVKTITQKRIAGWGLRPGLPIGCKITLRGESAKKMIVRLLDSKENKLKLTQFDNAGNISFGIHEYIDIKDVTYDPEIGIMGLEACITLERPGYRIKRRQILKKKISKTHRISREEAIDFMKSNFKIKMENEE